MRDCGNGNEHDRRTPLIGKDEKEKEKEKEKDFTLSPT